MGVIQPWLQLIDRERPNATTIAVHCVAGLGRAPVLVAIGLIELGMEPLDAIEFIRRKRRGAFNKPQITWLDHHYKPQSKISFKSSFRSFFKFGLPKKTSVPLSV